MNHQLNNFTEQILRQARLVVCAALLGGLALAQQAQAQGFVVANAASYGAQATTNPSDAYKRRLAPDMIAAAFGTFVPQGGQTYVATMTPLPTTLGGVRLQINNVDAPLFFVAPGQINFAIPPNLADTTTVTLRVFNSNNTQATGACLNGPCEIVRSSPGIFSIKATGADAAAALTTFDGVTYTPVFNPDLSVANVDAGTKARPNILVIYGTGIRRIPAANPNDGNGVAESLSVTLQGVPLTVAFAGPAPGFVGLDQINAILPPEAAGLGICKLVMQQINPSLSPVFFSNAVDVKMGGNLPDIQIISTLDIDQTGNGQPTNGELTADDQIQLLNDGSGRTYFFDTYRFFTTQANQTVGIDMRRDNTGGNQLDSAALLYRRVGNSLEQVAEDDDLGSADGGAGNNESVRVTRNALLLTVLPTAGEYVIFVTSANKQRNGLGKYSVRVFNAPIRQLTYGQNLTSESITTSDLKNSENVSFDVFYFNGNSGDNVDIRTTSAAYASLLILQRNGDSALQGTLGDAVSTGREARITQRLGESSTYLIYLTPFERDKFGNYSLSLNRVAGFDEVATDEQPTTAPRRSIGGSRLNGRAVTRPIEQQ